MLARLFTAARTLRIADGPDEVCLHLHVLGYEAGGRVSPFVGKIGKIPDGLWVMSLVAFMPHDVAFPNCFPLPQHRTLPMSTHHVTILALVPLQTPVALPLPCSLAPPAFTPPSIPKPSCPLTACPKVHLGTLAKLELARASRL